MKNPLGLSSIFFTYQIHVRRAQLNFKRMHWYIPAKVFYHNIITSCIFCFKIGIDESYHSTNNSSTASDVAKNWMSHNLNTCRGNCTLWDRCHTTEGCSGEAPGVCRNRCTPRCTFLLSASPLHFGPELPDGCESELAGSVVVVLSVVASTSYNHNRWRWPRLARRRRFLQQWHQSGQ